MIQIYDNTDIRYTETFTSIMSCVVNSDQDQKIVYSMGNRKVMKLQGPLLTNHSYEHSLSFSPKLKCTFECNTTSDWLHLMVHN